MGTKETITALFALLIALVWAGWDFVCDYWQSLEAAHKWVVGVSAALLFGLAFWRAIVPIIWNYGTKWIM